MRTLIAGTCYVADEGKRELVQLWARTIRHLNPDCDVILVDSASPFDPCHFLGTEMENGLQVVPLGDNIGAISQGHQDGSGRAFCHALSWSCESGYDYVALIEADLILAKPVAPIVEKMHRIGVNVAAPMAAPYQFAEWGCSFWSTEYLKDSEFVARYDWQNAPKWPIPEWRIFSMVEDEFFTLPVHGCRNDDNRLNAANIVNFFPYAPPSWLTHCADFSLFYRLLDLNRVTMERAA